MPDDTPTTAGDAIAEILEPLASRLDDDAYWAKRDAEVRAQLEAEQRAHEETNRRVRVERMCAYGVPRRVAELVVSPDFDRDAIPVRAVRDRRSDGVVVLSGGVGIGKTAAAVWWQLHHGGTRPAFVRASEVEAAGRYDRTLRARWTEASSLVLDDLGMEYSDAPGNLAAVLDELVDLYHADRRTLVVTTNLLADDFRERYGARVTSRIRGDRGWVRLLGEDRRSAR